MEERGVGGGGVGGWGSVRLRGEEMQYLVGGGLEIHFGLPVRSHGERCEKVKKRIQAGRKRSRKVSGGSCDRKSLRLGDGHQRFSLAMK